MKAPRDGITMRTTRGGGARMGHGVYREPHKNSIRAELSRRGSTEGRAEGKRSSLKQTFDAPGP